MFKGIVAVDKEMGIGYKNDLLFKSSDDLKHFKKMTTGQIVVMGRKTYESLKKPLPNRLNVVLSKKKKFKVQENTVVFEEVNDMISFLEKHVSFSKQEIWLMGGSMIYHLLQNHVDEWWITEFDETAEKKDAYFEVDLSKFEVGKTKELADGLIAKQYVKTKSK